jgi:hypothetical protein
MNDFEIELATHYYSEGLEAFRNNEELNKFWPLSKRSGWRDAKKITAIPVE